MMLRATNTYLLTNDSTTHDATMSRYATNYDGYSLIIRYAALIQDHVLL